MAKESKSKETFPEKEKKWIWERLDAERREHQKYKELQLKRLKNKKIYKLVNKTLYKILNMNRVYYVGVKDSKKFSFIPQTFSIYYQGFDGLKQKDVLIQIKDYTDKIYLRSIISRSH